MTDDLPNRLRELGEQSSNEAFALQVAASRIETLTAEVARLRAEALDAQPGFTADDLRRAWELCRDAAAMKCNSEVEFLQREADYAEQTSRNRLAEQYEAKAIACKEMAGSIRDLTPPADLADKVKEGNADG